MKFGVIEQVLLRNVAETQVWGFGGFANEGGMSHTLLR